MLELGVGHSRSDVVIYLRGEKVVSYGDVFLNGVPALPGEGDITQTIAHYMAISDADLRMIFEPFYRSSRSGETGSGLGLAITKKIVERLGGTIEA